ncbi:MAG: flagellar motor protein MotA [Bacteroidota bacterium]|jgi:biopolymer transport protein ExbB|nr:flagellar motor protein MotA [Bacteroidota bacterium]
MSNQKSTTGGFNFMTALLAIVISLLIGIGIYVFVLGAPGNFDAEGHPKQGNMLGMMHAGGFIVPILMAIFIIIVTFSIERLITIGKAKGTGSADVFLRNVKALLAANQYDEALALCDKQRGSLANVVRSGIEKLQAVKMDGTLNNEDKIEAVQKELEEATSLELPMLSKNLAIITTCATIATLWGLIGTVLGMIRSFAAMSAAGSPDTAALATGISEALINTAIGIIGSVVGIIMYNYFSSRVDAITHSMDEAGYSILHTLKTAR